MRLAIDARFYRRETAGVGRYTRGLLHALMRLDLPHEVTVILRPADRAEFPNDPLPPNWRLEVLDIPHYSLAEQLVLPRWLAARRFDLVHFTMFNHPLAYRGPFVVTIHDLTMTHRPPHGALHPRTIAYRTVMRHAARAARCVIVPSAFTAGEVVAAFGVTRLVVTPEAVESSFHRLDDAPRFAELRQRWGLREEFVLSVNAWRPHKGLPDLLDAFERVRERRETQLVVVGRPQAAYPEVARAVAEAQARCPDIVTPGFVSDDELVALLSMATAAVFASHNEGFGLGALEALACGCPLVCADNSSLPEVLGDAGLMYATGDGAKLAETLLALLADPARQAEQRRLGIERAGIFSFDHMALQTAKVYEEAVA
jgi:glycosyltransferase involved in cell wall biosynthesis